MRLCLAEVGVIVTFVSMVSVKIRIYKYICAVQL